MPRILYSEEAQNDVDEIYVYIATENSPASADRIIDSLVETCNSLAEFPRLGRRREEFDHKWREARSIGNSGYQVFYTEYRGDVVILRILHGSRDFENL
jgi:toxin ParE1/3/4